MTGGTFSISNGGVFRLHAVHPIINPPSRPLWVYTAGPCSWKTANRRSPDQLPAMSYDHRIIDGREAVIAWP